MIHLSETTYPFIAGHDIPIDEVIEHLQSHYDGLSSNEAEKRLIWYGKNHIDTGEKTSALSLFLEQFKDILVLILIAAGIITAIIGIIEYNIDQAVDFLAIAIVVILNASLGFYQEYSAEKAIESLKKLAVSEVTVIRKKTKIKINAEDIVPGDIVILEAGTLVPADVRLIEAYELYTSEAILTGESLPVRKRIGIVTTKTSIHDRYNIVWKGTTITTGSGTGIVIATGLQTELGKIAASLSEIKSEDTPLQKRLKEFAAQLAIAVIILSAFILVLGLFFLHQDLANMFIFSIGLAVAAVPEGLPAVLTLSLALGVSKMSQKKALIRRLPAVEVLGSATVICTDKTGTLTKNEMTVQAIWTDDERYTVSGTGYSLNGDILLSATGVPYKHNSNSTLDHIIEGCLLVNDASIIPQPDHGSFKIFGDPTEVALLVLGAKAGLTVHDLEQIWTKKYVFPFDSDRKRMSAILQNKHTQQYVLLVKGAVDVLLDLCSSHFINNEPILLTEQDKERIKSASEGYSKSFAYRNLGFALRTINQNTAEELLLSEDHMEAERDLTFIGFVGMIDPPRDQSTIAIKQARQAGIKVIMITGDHQETAKAVGVAIGLIDKNSPTPILGSTLDDMSDNDLDNIIDSTTIFARVSPHHKLRIVNSLKRKGHVCIMTGDGVNDAPALKRADIGVAMGITGTDVAKEASSMVLIDDNFANIVESITEGRLIYDNMKKFIAYLLSANFGEILIVFFGLLAGIIFFNQNLLPLVAIQLLYINLVTDALPALALGVDTPEGDLMIRPPRNPNEPLLDKNLLSMILVMGIVICLESLFCYYYAIDFGRNITDATKIKATTMAFVSLCVYELVQAINSGEIGTALSKDAFNNKVLYVSIIIGMLLVLIAVYVPYLHGVLYTTELKPIDWLVIGITAIPILVVEEIRKMIVNPKKMLEKARPAF